VTGPGSSGDPLDAYSRLIRRTSVIDVLAGLGALIPGYVLMIPRRHIRSLGELTLPELQHVLDAAWTMVKRLTRIFGGSVVLVEHGSSGVPRGPSGACIEHAHMHLFPVDSGSDTNLLRLHGSQRIRDLSELCALAQEGRNYYFSATASDEYYLSADPDLGSQYARRVWATTVSKPDEWDWGLFPFLDNVRLTATRLRRDELPFAEAGLHLGDTELAETLKAYTAAADWYASRTADFPIGSTLRSEMDWLASRTKGPILDAGTGGGRDARYLARFGREVVALAASAALLLHIPPTKNLISIVGDIRCLPLVNESIGAIWCSAVLLHLGREEVVQSLREFYRVVQRGGLVQVSVKEGSGHVSSSIAGYPHLRRHFFLYEEGDLRQFARLAGFCVLKFWAEEELDSTATVQRWIKVLLQRPCDDNTSSSPPRAKRTKATPAWHR
jgi:diadenosine tetraphosphate (Ap4A) HIT family hydrolase/SAM-dependent methyltransferase